MDKKLNLTELTKLYFWLNNYDYTFTYEPLLDGAQIVVYSEGERLWDAVCHNGSYGHEDGLLEIMGAIVKEDAGDDVEGWLTADDVIERVLDWEKKNEGV